MSFFTQDIDFWLVMASLAITTLAIGTWINRAGDEWLHSQLDPDFPESARDNAPITSIQDPA